MAVTTYKKIHELDPVTSFDPVAEIAVDNAEDTLRLEIQDIVDYALTNSNLLGTPTAPTPAPGTDNQQVATTEFVQNELAGLGLNPATSSAYGTVRTTTTESVPTVYTKTVVDSLLGDVNTALSTTNGNVTSVSNRVTTLEGQTLNSRLNTLEGQNLNTRLTAAESTNTTQTTNITNVTSRVATLEGYNTNSRLNTLEGYNAGTRLTSVESTNSTQDTRLTKQETFGSVYFTCGGQTNANSWGYLSNITTMQDFGGNNMTRVTTGYPTINVITAGYYEVFIQANFFSTTGYTLTRRAIGFLVQNSAGTAITVALGMPESSGGVEQVNSSYRRVIYLQAGQKVVPQVLTVYSSGVTSITEAQLIVKYLQG